MTLLQLLFPVVVFTLVPVAFIVGLLTYRYNTKTEWLVSAGVAGAFTGYALLVGPWDILSYYLRPAILLALVVAFVVSLARVRRAPWWRRPTSFRGWSSLGTNVFLCVLFSAMFVLAARGLSAGDGRHVDLSFPLGGGVSYVGQGGASPLLNYHNVDAAQAFAVDVVGLNSLGSHAHGLMPGELDRYAVFGRDVVSPCTGEVVGARDGLPDMSPPATDEQNLAGNHVVVRCEGVDVLLAHLREGSVSVNDGDTVREGDPIGRVGNTGNTTEPHLHVHAVKTGSGSFLEGEGVPIRFDGRFLARNGLVFGG